MSRATTRTPRIGGQNAFPRPPLRRRDGSARPSGGHFYYPGFIDACDREQILGWLAGLTPIWEYRYSQQRPLPAGQSQRKLLRPVYWLGNWQFACLDYYRPPKGTHDRCVQAEPFPEVLVRLVQEVESRIARLFPAVQLPRDFRLNTCLVNFYGSREEEGRWIDSARVGEHRDFEPGPVASLSLGERALFQFVAASRAGQGSTAPLLSQWLDDGSLQVFGGPLYKDRSLHRVQRVDRRLGIELPPSIDGFRTRRVNFTFRHVPDAHVLPFSELAPAARADIREYVAQLARHSPFFRKALECEALREEH